MAKTELHRLSEAFVIIWGSWKPLVDITESSDRWCVRIEVPGVDPESISLKVDRYQLSVEGRKDPPVATKLLVAEREYGSFFLKINLPDTVIPSTAHATLKNGLLEVSFQKSQRSFTLEIEGGEDE